MRIALVNWTLRRAGGAESYIESVASGFDQAGHETAILSIGDLPADREPIALPQGMPVWRASELGAASTLAALRRWAPDLLYVHCDLDADFETRLFDIAPAIFFAHAYRGTCVSGLKSHRSPEALPCERRFGWQCLLHYYPRRCGGLNPVTMLTEYRRQREQLSLLRSYKMILTASEHMRREYVRHGLPPEIVCDTHLPAASVSNPDTSVHLLRDRHANGLRAAGTWRLLFVGRMTQVKGVDTLLTALPLASKRIGSPLEITLVGDGPERSRLEKRARRLVAQGHGVEIKFTGWVGKAILEELYTRADLLVMPSHWPEPFGLAGIEAGLRGVPAAAFAVGGIPEWLTDGVNGHLAAAHPPTAAGLADAIAKCLDPRAHRALRRGAYEIAAQFTLERHIAELSAIFRKVAPGSFEIRDAARL